MSNYYFLANSEQKEYIECESKCSPKYVPMLCLNNCQFLIARTLLITQMWDIIEVFQDNEDLPWNDNPAWKNVWSRVLKEMIEDDKDNDYKDLIDEHHRQLSSFNCNSCIKLSRELLSIKTRVKALAEDGEKVQQVKPEGLLWLTSEKD